jgi:hypothetical protein
VFLEVLGHSEAFEFFQPDHLLQLFVADGELPEVLFKHFLSVMS